ncbi:MAG: PH domain-containing protein [Planctomycetaceae bacterium]|jgi:membrane protein YdbS with pleckstrin-like domain|nr:PH domain-containing protein [Planctomycetaceae bacterium]
MTDPTILADQHQEDNNENQDDQQTGKSHQQDQTMDQAVDKSRAASGPTPESFGVTWLQGSYSGKKLRTLFGLTILATILFLVLAVLFRGRLTLTDTVWWSLMMVIPVILWIRYVCVYIYRTKTIKYRLTPHRLYNESGFLKRTMDTLEIIDIEDMRMEQTFWDRFLNGGVGTVIILSNDKTHPTIRLEALEHPQDVFESIDEMRRRQRSSGARVIRSVTS